MPSLPPRDGGSSSNGAGIRAIGPAITAVGMPHSADGTSEIVVSLDDVIDVTVDNVVALLPPFAISRGEHDAFGTSSHAVGLPGVAGKSLPPPPTGEHEAIGGPSGISLSPPRVLREHGWGESPHAAARSLVWVDGTLACYQSGDKAIDELGTPFSADSVFSHPPSPNDGGERRLGGTPCLVSRYAVFGICHDTPKIC